MLNRENLENADNSKKENEDRSVESGRESRVKGNARRTIRVRRSLERIHPEGSFLTEVPSFLPPFLCGS